MYINSFTVQRSCTLFKDLVVYLSGCNVDIIKFLLDTAAESCTHLALSTCQKSTGEKKLVRNRRISLKTSCLFQIKNLDLAIRYEVLSIGFDYWKGY